MSEVKKFILLHLPFNQHSKLVVKSGVQLGEAIAKVLEKRIISPEMCNVHADGDPKSPTLDLNMDLAALAKQQDEIWVISDRLERLVSIEHDFVKNSDRRVRCDMCKEKAAFSFRCRMCRINFCDRSGSGCGMRVPTYCNLLTK